MTSHLCPFCSLHTIKFKPVFWAKYSTLWNNMRQILRWSVLKGLCIYFQMAPVTNACSSVMRCWCCIPADTCNDINSVKTFISFCFELHLQWKGIRSHHVLNLFYFCVSISVSKTQFRQHVMCRCWIKVLEVHGHSFGKLSLVLFKWSTHFKFEMF
jgi:hypothetical protein